MKEHSEGNKPSQRWIEITTKIFQTNEVGELRRVQEVPLKEWTVEDKEHVLEHLIWAHDTLKQTWEQEEKHKKDTRVLDMREVPESFPQPLRALDWPDHEGYAGGRYPPATYDRKEH